MYQESLAGDPDGTERIFKFKLKFVRMRPEEGNYRIFTMHNSA
jgi:hypothetical protein